MLIIVHNSFAFARPLSGPAENHRVKIPIQEMHRERDQERSRSAIFIETDSWPARYLARQVCPRGRSSGINEFVICHELDRKRRNRGRAEARSGEGRAHLRCAVNSYATMLDLAGCATRTFVVRLRRPSLSSEGGRGRGEEMLGGRPQSDQTFSHRESGSSSVNRRAAI